MKAVSATGFMAYGNSPNAAGLSRTFLKLFALKWILGFALGITGRLITLRIITNVAVTLRIWPWAG